MDDEPTLPRPNDDPDRLKKLREDARKRLDTEARQPEYPVPAPVYGGAPPPPPIPSKRWTMRGLLILGAVLLFGILAWISGRVIVPMPVYGGPPLPGPQPPSAEPRK
ncbi:MAG TPA: hypothetical protein VGL53_27280 [Bryobacteraceae bacterium]|jgi:hypothetical protein